MVGGAKNGLIGGEELIKTTDQLRVCCTVVPGVCGANSRRSDYGTARFESFSQGGERRAVSRFGEDLGRSCDARSRFVVLRFARHGHIRRVAHRITQIAYRPLAREGF